MSCCFMARKFVRRNYSLLYRSIRAALPQLKMLMVLTMFRCLVVPNQALDIGPLAIFHYQMTDPKTTESEVVHHKVAIVSQSPC